MLVFVTSVSYFVCAVCIMRPLYGLPKDKFYLSFGGALQNAVIARH